MRHSEFYIKRKANYPPVVNPIFPLRNGWRIVVTTAVVVLIEPMIIMYKNHRLAQFSLPYYFELIEYLLLIVVPFLVFLFWVNWRDWIKRKSGYVWSGKFEVVSKQSSFIFAYLLLAPGIDNKVKVSHTLFQNVRVGDFVEIRRDALGSVEEITKIKAISIRLTRGGSRRFPTKAEADALQKAYGKHS